MPEWRHDEPWERLSINITCPHTTRVGIHALGSDNLGYKIRSAVKLMWFRVRGAVSYRLFPLYRRWSLQFIMIGCYGTCSCSSLFKSGFIRATSNLGTRLLRLTYRSRGCCSKTETTTTITYKTRCKFSTKELSLALSSLHSATMTAAPRQFRARGYGGETRRVDTRPCAHTHYPAWVSTVSP
ncbi:hypothetical protein QR685DRAFT_96751 [Neurospora intermedia]|uniref:Uncharacterized protein n=1 Tax=Neurospora intermedia TaxID=5142 RepID=A0ABR3D2V9_NEUIN